MLHNYATKLEQFIGYKGPIYHENIDLEQANTIMSSVENNTIDDVGSLTKSIAAHLGLELDAVKNLTENKTSQLYAFCHVATKAIEPYLKKTG